MQQTCVYKDFKRKKKIRKRFISQIASIQCALVLITSPTSTFLGTIHFETMETTWLYTEAYGFVEIDKLCVFSLLASLKVHFWPVFSYG